MTARRVGTIRYDVYVSAACSAAEAKTLPWITYDEAMAHLPQARWITAAAGGKRWEDRGGAHVNDAEAVLEAVIAGLGRHSPFSVVADGDLRLTQGLGVKGRPPALNRELWLLAHSELKRLGRIEAVLD